MLQGGRDSPKRSVSNVSGLFDVLVAAATGGEGNAAQVRPSGLGVSSALQAKSTSAGWLAGRNAYASKYKVDSMAF